MTGLPWLRLYASTLNNPKVQRLPDAVFKGWINLLCLVCERCTIPPVDDVAFALRMSRQAAEKLLQQLSEAGLIDGDMPHDWGLLQHQSDVSTNRVKQFRERKAKRDETVSETAGNGDEKRKCNAIEEEQIQNRTEQSVSVSPEPVDKSKGLEKVNGLISHAAKTRRLLSKEEKREAWAGKISNELCRRESPERAMAIIEAWQRGEKWAKDEFDKIDAILRAH